MAKTQFKIPGRVSAQPRLHQRAAETQAYGTVSHQLPLDLEEPVRLGNEYLMVDKAFVVDVDGLHELCRELKNYSLSVTGRYVTITRHDGGNGLNDVSFAFPIVADFSILSALHGNPESGLQACLPPAL